MEINYKNITNQVESTLREYEKIEVEKKQGEERKKEIRDFILSKSDSNQYYYKIVREPHAINGEPISKKLFELIDKYDAFENKDEYLYSDRGGEPRDTINYYKTITFKSYEECSLEEKKKIEDKQIDDKKKLDEILSNDSEEYNKKGKVSIPFYEESPYFNSLRYSSTLEIEITQRELAEYGILPEDLKWKSLEEISKGENNGKLSSKDIASASKDLTTKDVKGAKGFLTNLLDKFKNMFKGKE